MAANDLKEYYDGLGNITFGSNVINSTLYSCEHKYHYSYSDTSGNYERCVNCGSLRQMPLSNPIIISQGEIR